MTKKWTIPLVVVIASSSASGCSKIAGLFGKGESENPPEVPSSSPAPSASAAPASSPTVTIPAGTLTAGTRCEDVPRIATEELPGTAVQLSEFSIDAYPWPNDPTKAPVTNVSRDEAAQMCASVGKRLCTELEWERACKGANNHEFEYGNTYQPNACPTVAPGAGVMGTRAQCVSSFGVHDMHGLAWEWTDSPWGRGSSGGQFSVRGGSAGNGELVSRCANGIGRASMDKKPDTGFRCCSGARNAAEVNLAQSKQVPLAEEPAVDTALSSRLLAALPKEAKVPAGGSQTFEKIWRWHPRANEEIILGRTHEQAGAGHTGFRAVAYKLCGATAHFLGATHIAVDSLGNPGAGADAQGVSLKVTHQGKEGEVHFHYVYGRINVEHPPWMSAKTQADAGSGAVSAVPMGSGASGTVPAAAHSASAPAVSVHPHASSSAAAPRPTASAAKPK
jgi:formylglycine-generating enzyme